MYVACNWLFKQKMIDTATDKQILAFQEKCAGGVQAASLKYLTH